MKIPPGTKTDSTTEVRKAMYSYYGNFRTRTFANIFPTVSDFTTWYSTCGVPDVLLTGTDYAKYSISAIYFLLISYYANSHIKSSDENRFKLQLMAIIYEAGPVWQRQMYLQDKAMKLADDDVLRGAKAIYNHAMHPDTEPSTGDLEELTYIDDQNTTNWQKEKARGYAEAREFLDPNICSRFMQKFKKLFLTVLYPDRPLLYETEEEEESET